MTFAVLLGATGLLFAHGAPPTAPVRRSCTTDALGIPCDDAASDISWPFSFNYNVPNLSLPPNGLTDKTLYFFGDIDIVVPDYAYTCSCDSLAYPVVDAEVSS